ncbi:MAG: hypothetical protein OQL19_00730 [Gammaproteobacteria bacterium]|nr:hypothetical protein [Gammaproteobacteria bacterium]
MLTTLYQKISETIKQLITFTRFPIEPVLIPVKVQQNATRRYPPTKRKF